MEKTEEFKKTLSQIFTTLLDGFDKDRIKKNPILFEYMVSEKNHVLDDLSTVELMLIFPLTELISSALQMKYGEKADTNICNIVANWSFYDNHVEKLIDQFEGFSCVVDKSAHILRQYLKSKLTDFKPGFSETREHYWEPKFGSIEQWMAYIEGLTSLHYGKLEKFLPSYQALFDAGTIKGT